PTLMALLRLDRKRGDRTGVETLEADRFARFLAVAVGAFVETLQRRIDLGDQLALAVACPKFDGTVGFRRRPVRKIRMVGAFFCQVVEGFARFAQDVVFPGVQLRSKVSPLVCIHEFIVLVEDEIAKIDLLTQRDSPEEHLKARCISPRVTCFKPAETYP